MLTAGGGRLAGVDVADDHDVDVRLLLTVDNVRLCSFDATVGWYVAAGARGGTYPILTMCVFVWLFGRTVSLQRSSVGCS